MGMAIMEQNAAAQEEARRRALSEMSSGNATRTTHGSLFSNESRLDGPNNGAEKHFFPSITETDYNKDGSLMEHKKEQFPNQVPCCVSASMFLSMSMSMSMSLCLSVYLYRPS